MPNLPNAAIEIACSIAEVREEIDNLQDELSEAHDEAQEHADALAAAQATVEAIHRGLVGAKDREAALLAAFWEAVRA